MYKVRASTSIKDRVTGLDADIILEDGIKKLATTKQVQVDSLSGRQQAATNYFFIDSVSDGQTLTIDIDATEGSPAFNDTFTVNVSETKKEFADRIILELNQDFINFQPYYRALKIQDNAAVYFLAKTVGEAGENVNFDSFRLSGTVTATRAFADLLRRGSVVQASQSATDPRLAVFGIEGVVEARSADVSGLFIQQPYKNATPGDTSMAVDGSVTPVEFTFPMDALDDIFVTEIKFFAQNSGIKYDNFIGIASITNGIEIEIKTNNNIVSFPLVKTSADFADKFTFGGNQNFQLDKPAGLDKLTASFVSAPFPLRRTGTFGGGNDDYLKIIINDNLTSISQFEAIVEGTRREA